MYVDLEYIKGQFENVKEEFIFHPVTAASYQEVDVKNLLIHCTEIGASDIHIEGGKFIVVDIHSKLYPVSTRKINEKEAETIIKKIYDDTAIAEINQKEAINTNYTIKHKKEGKKNRYRFRINTVGTFVGELKTVQITIRTLASLPPKLYLVNKGERLDTVPSGHIALEREIWDVISPDQGMIMVTGPTGSGKSTLLAAIIRKLLETENFNKKIVTCEAPIEYVFDEVKAKSGFISQTEIYTQLHSFYKGVEEAMRRKPDIIFIGEARDVETIDTSIMAAQTGHLLYTTMHTNSVGETVKRAINVFPENERQSKLMDLIDTTQMIIAQRLIKTLDGKRCAVKEYLHFDKEVKDILRDTNPLNISQVINGMVRGKKQRLIDDIHLRLEEGLISKEDFRQHELSYGKFAIDEEQIFDIEMSEIEYQDPKVFFSKTDCNEIHVGIVLDKKDDNYGKIAFVPNDVMGFEMFQEQSNTRYNFSVCNEKITSKEIILKLKSMLTDNNK